MKYLPIICLIPFASLGQHKQTSKAFSVNGTYSLNGKTYKKGDDIYGYFGKIKVKQLESNSIAVSFFICKGAPSYSSGSFVDTLILKGNTSVYRTDCDSNCTLIFKFTKDGVNTIHEDADGDYNFSCCFGHAVVADGYFRKTSSRIPAIKDPDFD